MPSAKLKKRALLLMQPAQAGGGDQWHLKDSMLPFGNVNKWLVALWSGLALNWSHLT